MSHTVIVSMIADQEIEIAGKMVNIHDIDSIIVNADGVITDALVSTESLVWLFIKEGGKCVSS